MSRAASSTQGMAYQGYPYVNPTVIDPPSLSPAEVAAMARWQNLPRRPLKADGAGGSGINAGSGSSSLMSDSVRIQDSGLKEEEEDQPVVYIDIPESNASGVSQVNVEENEPSYVQETILYDPFKDRRIDIPRDSDSESEGTPSRGLPQRPNHLNLDFNTPGSSSGYGSVVSANTLPPTFMSKEAYVYGRQPTPDDGFLLSPIPVSDFPAPPPAYEEIQGTSSVNQTQTPVSPSSPTQPSVITDQPRTQVITQPDLPPDTMLFDGARKVVSCQHCGATVQTLVVRQNGFWTHMLACFFFVFFMPFILVIYITDIWKYKNHYCPRCNKKIGHQNPICCEEDLTFD